MEGWTWKALCNEAPFRFGKNLASSGIRTRDPKVVGLPDTGSYPAPSPDPTTHQKFLHFPKVWNNHSNWSLSSGTWMHVTMNTGKVSCMSFYTDTLPQVAQRATIAHLNPMCQGQSAPKPYAAFPPLQWSTHKIWSRLANWLQRYSSSKVWNFNHSRASNSKMSGRIRPKINSTELLCLSWLPATLF